VGHHRDPGGVEVMTDPQAFEQPDEVLGCHIPGGARSVGTASQPAGRGVHLVDSPLQSDDCVGDRLSVGVVKVDSDPIHIDPTEHLVEKTVDVSRGRLADGLAQEHLIHSPLEEGFGEMRHPVGILLAFERAVGSCGHIAAKAQAAGRLAQDASDPMHRLVHRGVEIALIERVRGSGQQPDPDDSGFHRSLEASHIGDEAPQLEVIPSLEPGDNCRPIGHLGNRFRAHERHRVEGTQPCVGEILDEIDLGLGRDVDTQRLQPITGRRLCDRHPGGQVAHAGDGTCRIRPIPGSALQLELGVGLDAADMSPAPPETVADLPVTLPPSAQLDHHSFQGAQPAVADGLAHRRPNPQIDHAQDPDHCARLLADPT
jgi:hypothetical protein